MELRTRQLTIAVTATRVAARQAVIRIFGVGNINRSNAICHHTAIVTERHIQHVRVLRIER